MISKLLKIVFDADCVECHHSAYIDNNCVCSMMSQQHPVTMANNSFQAAFAALVGAPSDIWARHWAGTASFHEHFTFSTKKNQE